MHVAFVYVLYTLFDKLYFHREIIFGEDEMKFSNVNNSEKTLQALWIQKYSLSDLVCMLKTLLANWHLFITEANISIYSKRYR